MELRQLRYFEAVARTGSYSAAALASRVAQPALWKQVRALEKELGTPLFERTGRRVRITRQGAILLEEAERVLAAGRRLTQLAADVRAGLAGRVVVACSPPQVTGFLAGVVGGLAISHPELRVDLREHPPFPDTPAAELQAGIADLAMDLYLGEGVPGMVAYRVRVVAIPPPDHPWAIAGRVEVAQLRNERLLLAPVGFGSRDRLDNACRRAGFEPRVASSSPSPATLLALGDAGVGIPVFADDAQPPPRMRPLAVVVEAGRPLEGEVWLHWRAGTTSEAVETFITAAKRAAAASSSPVF